MIGSPLEHEYAVFAFNPVGFLLCRAIFVFITFILYFVRQKRRGLAWLFAILPPWPFNLVCSELTTQLAYRSCKFFRKGVVNMRQVKFSRAGDAGQVARSFLLGHIWDVRAISTTWPAFFLLGGDLV